MDGFTIQARVYAGYAKAAARVGLPHHLYRPADPMAPLAAVLVSLAASFNVKGAYTQPNIYGNALWQCIADGAQLRVGDYLRGAATYFIAALQPLLPILAVECNRTIQAARVAAASGAGVVGYNGGSPATEVAFLTGWPASVLRGPPGEKNPVGLPDDVRQPWFQVLLPASAGPMLRPSDIITDDLGNRYICGQVELTDLGWRLMVQQAVT